MGRETPRNLALKILDGLSRRRGASTPDLDDPFFHQPHLTARDKGLITHLVQGVLRWRLRLDWVIEQVSDVPLKKIDPRVLTILRLAVYQIFFLDRVPDSAAVNEAVKQAKTGGPRHVAPFVNGILRTICRKKEALAYPDRHGEPARYLSVYYSYPPWLVEKWLGEWGDAFTEGLLSAGNRLPVLTIRVNTLKTGRKKLLGILEDEGVAGIPTPYAPEGIQLPDFRGRVKDLDAFSKGLFQVQDQAAQITSHLLQPVPGDSVLDICGGLGGKATHLAQLMEDRGHVISLDIHFGRLLELRENARRLGIGNVFPLAANAELPLGGLFHRLFDRIMVDAPCSGLGVLSKHPDGKWNREKEDIRRLSRLQQKILTRAADLLRPGGRMLYVTCTLSKEENEGVVGAFLKKQPDFSVEDLKTQGPAWVRELIDEQGFFRTFPHLHDMGGFFGALLSKRL